MESAPNYNIIEPEPGITEFMRSKYNLNGPGRMEEAVSLLDKWVRLQPHFKKKDFSTQDLEFFIIRSKGSIEKAKMRLDKYCTIRTLLPQFFGRLNDLGNLFDHISAVILPKATQDHSRIYLVKLHDENITQALTFNYIRYGVAVAEHIKLHDYLDSIIVIFDVSDVNISECVFKLDLVLVRQSISIFLDCYGARIKSIHTISESKLLDGFISFFKQFFSPKIKNRCFSNKNISELYDIFDKKILPKEYGGEEKSLREIQDDWVRIITSEKYQEHLENMRTATTDETLRPKDQFNEHYAGMPGTFRTLTVD